MKCDSKDVIYEIGQFWVLKVKTGFEVYKDGVTHSVRCAQIGWTDEQGEKRAIAEADRRHSLCG